MIKILLTQNRVALIDKIDYPRVSQYKWCVSNHRNTSYAQAWINGKAIKMHSFIFGKRKGKEIDHKNGNGLDNRRSNLRFGTHSQNLMNFKSKRLYRWVYWSEEKKKWRVYICKNYVQRFVGYFSSEKEAALAYNVMANKLFGEFSRPNETGSK